jgi:hypothetical protein
MPEYRIETEALTKRHEMKGRLLAWGAVVLLTAIPILTLALRVLGLLGRDPSLRWLAVLAMLFAVVGATILAWREALRFAEREMIFILDDTGIVRRRQVFPDVKIAFSEVDTLSEELRWLVIKSVEPYRKIAIPHDVRGFETIRAELTKHHRAVRPSSVSPVDRKSWNKGN